MCGIAGIFSSDELLRQRITAMNAELQHRGPDAHAEWTEGQMSLAHSRLSIIDVSEAAHQPMVSACGRYVIAFNGEVYNFKQLAQKLLNDFPETYGRNGFKTQSDTEVVLELFAAYGPESVKMLNGMFAYAVYDRNEKKLFLFRDRVGIKPLFYSQQKTNLSFASELRSLMKALSVKTFNAGALPLYLHVGYFPEPHTVINEAKKFPAAHYGVWNGVDLTLTKYWNPEDFAGQTEDISFSEATERFKNLLEESVTDSLISDVPLGVFLSGGIDSSLVASVAASRASGRIKTFTVSSPDALHDESTYARKIAQHLNSEHYEMAADEKAMLDLALPLLQQMDEPLADSSFFPVYIISKFARQHVTVALGGDGGDELFQGYGSYVWAKRLSNFWVQMGSPMARLQQRSKRHYQFFHSALKKHFKSNIFSIEQNLFPSWELDSLKFSMPEHFPEVSRAYLNLSPAASQAFFDLTHYLKDDLLVKIDRASMLTSLEVRPPLLDHRLVEASLHLPMEFKTKNGNTKLLLKEILAEYVPRELFERPKKGFSVPMQRWLKTDLSFLPEKYLEQSGLRLFDAIPKCFVQNIVKQYKSGKVDWYYNRVWVLTVLSHYLEQHSDIEIPKLS
ncbi:MAG: asparagine synthase (glutamine-hydrolyzing) [Bacteroidetes bacterium GWF2_43_63]|nr:MAG: asparagine synthase (glutamine-hydrolyzing) [Bacteroidetes bacterium GWE2_42_42]OFY53275.1 MAG: asparagine synthase (glutamine-hydrolyzing) [Bacteroidetes bacterium GWF2_43_63]